MKSMMTLQSIHANGDIVMGSITIRNLDERTKARLRLRAARHGRSMEEEARTLLRSALGQDAARNRRLGDSIHARFQALGGVELELPSREGIREPPGAAVVVRRTEAQQASANPSCYGARRRGVP